MQQRPSVRSCKEMLECASVDDLPAMIARLADDDRPGVRSAVVSAQRRVHRAHAESVRLESLSKLEDELRSQGYVRIAGADEVGRGALAGPLTIAAVILPPGARIEGLDDSKRLAPPARERLSVEIRSVALAYSIAHISPEEIDSIGISMATRRGLTLALEHLDPGADHVIVDGLGVGGLPVPETAVVGGDGRCAAVAAASVIAKVSRDAIMVGLDGVHPGYSFAVHKGYGTAGHLSVIASRGLTAVHRRSFSPCGGTLPLF